MACRFGAVSSLAVIILYATMQFGMSAVEIRRGVRRSAVLRGAASIGTVSWMAPRSHANFFGVPPSRCFQTWTLLLPPLGAIAPLAWAD